MLLLSTFTSVQNFKEKQGGLTLPSPCKSLLDNKIPYEMWTGNKPHISHMRKIGSRVVALKKGYRRNKFDPT
ncbi:hypothetical protein M0802_012615 [Mischocyttarus mexicanus]|nr:hypothetical protein M0802_012615 [Mischocyttarus mexicanus]